MKKKIFLALLSISITSSTHSVIFKKEQHGKSNCLTNPISGSKYNLIKNKYYLDDQLSATEYTGKKLQMPEKVIISINNPKTLYKEIKKQSLKKRPLASTDKKFCKKTMYSHLDISLNGDISLVSKAIKVEASEKSTKFLGQILNKDTMKTTIIEDENTSKQLYLNLESQFKKEQKEFQK